MKAVISPNDLLVLKNSNSAIVIILISPVFRDNLSKKVRFRSLSLSFKLTVA